MYIYQHTYSAYPLSKLAANDSTSYTSSTSQSQGPPAHFYYPRHGPWQGHKAPGAQVQILGASSDFASPYGSTERFTIIVTRVRLSRTPHEQVLKAWLANKDPYRIR